MKTAKCSVKFLYLTYIALMFLFTFSDLSISKALYRPDCAWAQFIQSYGTFPIMCVGIFCCLALFKAQQGKKGLKGIVKRVFFVLMILHYICYYLLTAISPLLFQEKSDIDKINTVLLILISIISIYCIFCVGSVRKLSGMNNRQLIKIANIGFYMCLLSTVCTDILKYIWMRERFCNLSAPDIEFTKWFVPRFLNGNLASSSFPSGHAAQAACIIWCTLLAKVIPVLSGKRNSFMLHAVSFLYVFVVMYSRILLGKHYATDVLTGAMITIVIFRILYRRTYAPKSAEENQKELRL